MVLSANSKKTAHLQGRSVITLFYENSTRTRLSFEMAAKFMGASTANVSASGSSINKGESLIDTARTIDAMATDILIMRHSQSGAPHLIAPLINASVINAGDGMNEHPTQALLDMFTMKQKKGSLQGLRVAIVGDVMHSRVARSNLWGLSKMGAEVRLFSPPTMMPRGLEQTGAIICPTVEDAVRDADVVMGLRIQAGADAEGAVSFDQRIRPLFCPGCQNRRSGKTGCDHHASRSLQSRRRNADLSLRQSAVGYQ